MIRFVTAALLSTSSLAFAAGDMSRQENIVMTMVLGTPSGELKFTPDRLSLETGKLYTLRLENPGAKPFYFSSPSLADAVYTRKVSIAGTEGKTLGEVYGPVRRLEVKPGGIVEWWFVPVRTGVFDDVISTKAHADAGMRATIEIR